MRIRRGPGAREPVRFYGRKFPAEFMQTTVIYDPCAICPNCGAEVDKCNGMYQSHRCLRVVVPEP